MMSGRTRGLWNFLNDAWVNLFEKLDAQIGQILAVGCVKV